MPSHSSSKEDDDAISGVGGRGSRGDDRSVESHSNGEDEESEEDELAVVDVVWDFCRTSTLGDTLEMFVTNHLEELEDIQPLDQEQKLRHRELFDDLLAKCEKQISDFVEDKGFTVEHFVDMCREVRFSLPFSFFFVFARHIP